jgi:fatty acid kinase fatty acid binding subunit
MPGPSSAARPAAQSAPAAEPGDRFFLDSARRGQVVVVTDSSASAGAGGEDNIGVAIVALRVLAGGVAAKDHHGARLPEAIAAELARGGRLTTARPAPEDFAAVYRLAASAGVPAIVSVHLAAELSGTIGSARLAAGSVSVPVHVVDSRTIGAGLGFVVAAASRAARAGLPAAEVARAATDRAARTASFFALDTEEHLRAGGRLGGAGPARPAGAVSGADRAAAGSMLASRPLLRISDGTITVLERVRTRAAARDRLTELAAEFAAGLPGGCQLAVQFIGSRDDAGALHRQLTAAVPAVGRCATVQASTAILAHTGPGLLGVVVTPAL